MSPSIGRILAALAMACSIGFPVAAAALEVTRVPGSVNVSRSEDDTGAMTITLYGDYVQPSYWSDNPARESQWSWSRQYDALESTHVASIDVDLPSDRGPCYALVVSGVWYLLRDDPQAVDGTVTASTVSTIATSVDGTLPVTISRVDDPTVHAGMVVLAYALGVMIGGVAQYVLRGATGGAGRR